MIVLQIEHPVPDYNNWKKAFDADPLKRRDSGVKSYKIFKTMDDPNRVMVELEFDSLENAQSMHEALKKLWNRVEGKIMINPQSRILEAIEIFEY